MRASHKYYFAAIFAKWRLKVFLLPDLLALLKQTGLNEYESKAYAVLLEMSSASAADVSRKAGIPRARVYDVLVGLEKKGFLEQEPSRPVRFHAFHPEIALNNLERARKKGFAAELSVLSGLKSALGTHANSLKKTNPAIGETAFLVSGAANIEAKIEELLKSASKEAIICTTESNLPRKTALLGKILKESALKIPVSLCFPDSEPGELLRKSAELQQLKNIEFLGSANPARFMVFDGKKSLLFLNHEKKEDEKALLIESESVARFLKETVKHNQ